MKCAFNLPVQIFFEQDCIKNHGSILRDFGKKAFIVTGRQSAKASGAFSDLVSVLDLCSIEWKLFDEIENNPSVETVDKASAEAKDFGADMIIGIGGGSPLDASKAIAVLCAEGEENPKKAVELFEKKTVSALPIIAIPTTAGTGSEATQYSVLLRRDIETKVSFGNQKTFPSVAFVDSKYTKGLSPSSTIFTAVDACTHCLEGFVCNRSQPFTDSFALSALKAFGETLPALKMLAEKKVELSDSVREKLMYVSLTGGMVIAHTGVTAVHGMGYCFTYFKGCPHGQANGFLTPILLEYTKDEIRGKLDSALKIMGYESVENGGISQFASDLEVLLGKAPVLTEEECRSYAKLSLLQKGSLSNTAKTPDENELFSIWKNFSR